MSIRNIIRLIDSVYFYYDQKCIKVSKKKYLSLVKHFGAINYFMDCRCCNLSIYEIKKNNEVDYLFVDRIEGFIYQDPH